MSASQQKLINLDIARVDAEEVRQAAEFQAAILADVAGRRGTRNISPAPSQSLPVIRGVWA